MHLHFDLHFGFIFYRDLHITELYTLHIYILPSFTRYIFTYYRVLHITYLHITEIYILDSHFDCMSNVSPEMYILKLKHFSIETDTTYLF